MSLAEAALLGRIPELSGVEMRSRAVFLSVALISVAGAWTSVPARSMETGLPTAIEGHFQAYVGCAFRHLTESASRDHLRTFQDVEGSLRPACGNHIAAVRRAVQAFFPGATRSDENQLIDQVYRSIQGQLEEHWNAASSAVAIQALRRELATQQEARIEEALACLFALADIYAVTTEESAETVSSAAIVECSSEIGAVTAIMALLGEDTDDILLAREEFKDRVLARVVRQRALSALERSGGGDNRHSPQIRPAEQERPRAF